jgi:hypothetical protein
MMMTCRCRVCQAKRRRTDAADRFVAPVRLRGLDAPYRDEEAQKESTVSMPAWGDARSGSTAAANAAMSP